MSSISDRLESPTPNWNHLLRRALPQLLACIRAPSGAPVDRLAILVINNRSALRMSNALDGVEPNVGKAARHKLLFDEAEALLSARFAAFLLESKGLSNLARVPTQFRN